MQYYIDLDEENTQAMVYTQVTRPEGVAHMSVVASTPTDALRRLMVSQFHRQIIVWSEVPEKRGVWNVRYSLK